MVVSTEKKFDRSKLLDIPLKSLLDGTKTFSELRNLKSPMKFDLPAPLAPINTFISRNGKSNSLMDLKPDTRTLLN